MNTSSKVKVWLHPREKGFWVEVPALPGCATSGESRDLALENAYESVTRAVEIHRAIGRPVPWQAVAEEVPAGIEVAELDPVWDDPWPEWTPEELDRMGSKKELDESEDLADILRSYGYDVRRGPLQ